MQSDPVYYLADDVRELDRLAIQEHGIPGFTLMQRAGQAAFNALLKKWPDTSSVLCFCGTGNNGGDGFIIAALATTKHLSAKIILLGSTDKLQGDARLAFEQATRAGVEIFSFEKFRPEQLESSGTATVIVDAMLGTGLSGEVRGSTLEAIRIINASGCPVLAVDIPSGLCSDTGTRLGEAVKADLTVTFIGRKLGQSIALGPEFCGEVVFDDLDVPGEIYEQISPSISN